MKESIVHSSKANNLLQIARETHNESINMRMILEAINENEKIDTPDHLTHYIYNSIYNSNQRLTRIFFEIETEIGNTEEWRPNQEQNIIIRNLLLA